MELRLAVYKTARYGERESGDTVEVVERPKGGLSIVLSDGQGHGRGAKRISSLVATKAAQLIADGARDGAVARAVHDHLFALRDGRVSATLTILSADLRSRTLVVSRNANGPVFVRQEGTSTFLEEELEPIGFQESMKPQITEVRLRPGTVVLSYTDGIAYAGRRHGRSFARADALRELEQVDPGDCDRLARVILEAGLRCDQHRPVDDMTVVALGVVASNPGDEAPRVRVMRMELPL